MLTLQRRHLAFDLDFDLSGQVALGYGGRHFGDRSHLIR